MYDWKKGIIKIDSDLLITMGYTVDMFKKSKYYDNQNFDNFFVLKNSHQIGNHNYSIGLYFKNGVIKYVTLMCVDKKISEGDEYKRKKIHDRILRHSLIFLKRQSQYRSSISYKWGNLSSEFDSKGWPSFIIFNYN